MREGGPYQDGNQIHFVMRLRDLGGADASGSHFDDE